jgi:peptidoglycan/LPS O-acetylase OafA/YrhL
MIGLKSNRSAIKEIIIILILAILAAFFIWRFFDYKIAKLKWSYDAKSEYHEKPNINSLIVYL